MIHSNDAVTIHPIVIPTKYSLKSFNFYILEHGNSLTLIDAGIDTEECWKVFTDTLAENGFSVSDLTEILLTHNHEDHIGIVNRITAIKDVPIYAHRDSIYRLKREEDYFALRVEFFHKLYEKMGCGEFGARQIEKLTKVMKKKVNSIVQSEIITIKESDIISGLKVYETPGHSPDHIVFFDEQRKRLFGGDHLVGHISSNAIVEPDREGVRIQTLSQYVHSLQKCSELDIEVVYPGHGEFIETPKELFNHRVERIHQKSNQILALIKDGHSTGNQLAQVFYRDKYNSEFALVMSEIIGHLDYLELNNKVMKVNKDGVWQYSGL